MVILDSSKSQIGNPRKSPRSVPAAACALVSASLFLGYGCMNENIARTQNPTDVSTSAGTQANANGSASANASAKLDGVESEKSDAKRTRFPFGYDSSANQFELNDTLRELAESAARLKTTRAKVDALFDALRVGGRLDVRFDKSTQMRAPRVPAQTLVQGGVCDELAIMWIGVVTKGDPKRNAPMFPGGAEVRHYKDMADDVDHMMAFAIVEGKRIDIDLQLPRPGMSAHGPFITKMKMDYSESEAIPHRDWADFLRSKNELQGAMAGFERSLGIFPLNDYALEHLASLKFRDEFEKGSAAFESKDYAGCARHFRMAAHAGWKSQQLGKANAEIGQENLDVAKKNQEACENNLGATGGAQ